MDRRLNERLRVRLEVRVADLADGGQIAQGEMTDVSDAGVCLVLPGPLAEGHVVRVDFSEGALFGQVMHVTSDGTGFRIGIEVFKVLLGNSDLARLLKHALGKTTATMPVHPAH